MTQLDIDRLAEITLAEIAARRQAGPPVSGQAPGSGPESRGSIGERLEAMRWHVDPVRPMPRESHRAVLGPLSGFTKRIVHRALRPFITDVLARQTRFNEATIAALEEIAADADERAGLQQERGVELAAIREVLRELAARTAPDPETERVLEGLRAAVVREARGPAAGTPTPAADPAAEEAERYRRFHEEASGFETTLEIFRQYVPYFRDCRRVVDLACGRGPFLVLMREAGVSAYGVDLNPLFVGEVEDQGLEAVQDDAIRHVEGLREGSVDGVFSGHLVEHLEPDALLRLFRGIHRALAEDGVFVLESPNTADLGVLAGAYFRDPTHRMPLHPETYRFLARVSGFASVEVEHSYPLEAVQRLREIDAGPEMSEAARATLNANFRRLNDLLFGARNFALVCRKRDGA